MNYKLIIANVIEEYKTQKTPYSTYFKRESKKAKNIEYEEFDDFFEGCLRIITLYKKHIKKQYLNDYEEADWALRIYKQNILNGVTKDLDGVLFQERVDRIEKDKENIKNQGYKTGSIYRCLITESGEITKNSFDSKHELFYTDLQNLENILLGLNYKPDKITKKETEPEFISYLQHPNKEALIKKLHELLDNSEGKPVAKTIRALIECSFITGYKSNEQLYRAMRKEFGEIGASAGLNSFLNENGKKIIENDIITTVEILQRVK